MKTVRMWPDVMLSCTAGAYLTGRSGRIHDLTAPQQTWPSPPSDAGRMRMPSYAEAFCSVVLSVNSAGARPASVAVE